MTTATDTVTRDRLIEALSAIELAHDALEAAMESLDPDVYKDLTISATLYDRLDDLGWGARNVVCDLTEALRRAIAASH
jgi:hypothetical protein